MMETFSGRAVCRFVERRNTICLPGSRCLHTDIPLMSAEHLAVDAGNNHARYFLWQVHDF